LKGIAVKPMGDAYLDMGNYTIKSEGENKVVYQQRLAINKSKDPESDTYAYQQGYITVTPLKFDWTAYEMIKPIALWDLVIK
jgi:5'-nucleotidase